MTPAVALRDRIRSEHTVAIAPVAAGEVSSPALLALGSLRDSDQEVLMLVAWDGLDRRQAAAALGITNGALSVRLHRARRRLAKARAAQDSTPESAEAQSSTMEAT